MSTDALVLSMADEGHSARLTAGFSWPWSNPNADGTLVPDVKVGAWQMLWNARPDAGRLAPGIPPSNFWASDPNGIDQVGCVYTAQGFEFDYVGVIWGRDLGSTHNDTSKPACSRPRSRPPAPEYKDKT